MELPKRYDHKVLEEKWYSTWEERGYFCASSENVKKGLKKPYTLMMPPPNVTGIVHMGHILNNTLQDILARWKRMQGYEVLWQPGTDHAGIATQNVVEKELTKEGKTRLDIGRETFIELAWRWKDKHEKEIIKRLKRLGISADWSRYRFTLDPKMSRAVTKAFIELFNQGLIYRGLYIINWCPRCGTALADDEIEYQEHQGYLWYIKYPLVDGGFIVVATTRPETYLGDTAVAVNPNDRRYQNLTGKKARLPLIDWVRKGTLYDGTGVNVEPEIPIIEDDMVNAEFGTGAVKVTPAHDPNDFEIGEKHGLPRVTIMDREAKTNSNAGRFAGLSRYDARKIVVQELKKNGFIDKIEEYTHSVGHCYRCNTVVEPYLSEEWFVKMKPLAEGAVKVVKEGHINLIPEYSKKIYFNWLENVRDWCISRKIWWGHRIPVYTCGECGHLTVSEKPLKECPKCGSQNINQDLDVLDTWFSSWLWPFSTLGWPEDNEVLRSFYPTDVLITGWDILFFWVARMIMAGLTFMKEIPFHTVYLHGIVRDEKRRKISKSLGNFVDPLEYIEKYGADGVRMGITLVVPEGQDIIFSEKRIEIGRNFATKIWNASRFLLHNIALYIKVAPKFTHIEDKWVITALNNTIKRVTKGLEEYEFNTTAAELYHFFWHDFCDWYLEVIKPRIKTNDSSALVIALNVLEKLLRLLHPFMPFVTEEIWQYLPNKSGETIMKAKWPKPTKDEYPTEYNEFEVWKLLVKEIREARAYYGIKPNIGLPLYIVRVDDKTRETLYGLKDAIYHLARIISFKEDGVIPHPSTTIVVNGQEFYLPLPGIDIEKEISRIDREIIALKTHLNKVRTRLNNPDFLEKAPPDVIKREEEKVKNFESKILALEKHRERLR